MTPQPHSIEIEITPDGEIKSEVKGVAGADCAALCHWLDELRAVAEDTNTPDFHKKPQAVRIGAGIGQEFRN